MRGLSKFGALTLGRAAHKYKESSHRATNSPGSGGPSGLELLFSGQDVHLKPESFTSGIKSDGGTRPGHFKEATPTRGAACGLGGKWKVTALRSGKGRREMSRGRLQGQRRWGDKI